MSSSVTQVISALWSKRPTLLFWRLRPLTSGTLPSFSLCYPEHLDSVSRDSSSWSLVSVSWSPLCPLCSCWVSWSPFMSPLLPLSLLKSLHVSFAPPESSEVPSCPLCSCLVSLSLFMSPLLPSESPEVTNCLLCSCWVSWSHFMSPLLLLSLLESLHVPPAPFWVSWSLFMSPLLLLNLLESLQGRGAGQSPGRRAVLHWSSRRWD